MEQALANLFSLLLGPYLIGLGFAIIFKHASGASRFTSWYWGGLFRAVRRFIGWLLRGAANQIDGRNNRRP